MLRNAGELFRDAFRREDVVDTPGRDRAARHGFVPRRVILRKRNAPFGLDRLQTERPVARRPGQNHANGQVTSVLGQRFEKAINGAWRRAFLRAGAERQAARRDAQVRVGGNDVHVIWLDRQVVRDLVKRQRRRSLEDRRKRAFVMWIEMLHQHESHARIPGQALEQLGECFEPAGRCADTHDWK
jgi:hypothetical protein